jgi:hypothetical protein
VVDEVDGVAAGSAFELVVFRMSALACLIEGGRRVVRAPTVVAGLWLTSALTALPFALALRHELAAHLGDSLAAETVASGVNFDWWNEFLAQASGLGQSFVPSILGFAAVLKNLSSIADAAPTSGVLASLVAAHIALSMFVLGGVLDRLARDRATAANGFFAACGVFFFRFLRLSAIAAAVYGALFLWLHPWLFDDVYAEWTRSTTVERDAFFLRVGFYAVFGVLLLAVNLLFDYAKIRMVVEDRRSAIGALTAAVRFIRRHPRQTVAVYLLNALLFLVVIAIYFVLAPGAGGGALVWIAFLIGQLYIVARIVVRLTFAASQIALFQRRLAHAGYVARPVPRWPDSPAASALGD